MVGQTHFSGRQIGFRVRVGTVDLELWCALTLRCIQIQLIFLVLEHPQYLYLRDLAHQFLCRKTVRHLSSILGTFIAQLDGTRTMQLWT